MADIVSDTKRSQMMAGIKGKNTKSEIYIRSLLHARGYRFRLHHKDLPGRPDIVLPKYKTAIFVQGCFWHGHDDCHLYRPPKTRTAFWEKKISGNKERDAKNLNDILDLGWRVLWVWECSLKGRLRYTEEKLFSLIYKALIDQGNFVEIRGQSLIAS